MPFAKRPLMVYPFWERAPLHSYFHSTLPTTQRAVLVLRRLRHVAALPETIPSPLPPRCLSRPRSAHLPLPQGLLLLGHSP